MENDALSENISKILNDPEGMAKIQAMAESLFGGEALKTEEKSPSFEEMNMIKNAIGMLKNDASDERGRLLLALKPHLTSERQERVDKAVKLLKIMRIAPLISKSELFDL